MNMTLANAVPSSIDALFSLYQHSTPQLIPFNTNVSTYDDDGDAIASLVIQTLPTKGVLYHQGVAITAVGTAVTDLANFTYLANNATAYTIRAGTNCTSPGAYTSFTIKVTDAQGTSVQASSIYICLVDVSDIPIVQDQTLAPIRLGNTTVFTLTLVDPDDFYTPLSLSRLRDSAGNFTTNITVYFPYIRGLFGYLATSNGSACNADAPLVANQLYPYFDYQGQERFIFCYVANGTDGLTWGNDVFEAEVLEGTGLESVAPGLITFQVLNPLEACDSSTASACLVTTTEHPDTLSITLLGRDWFQDGSRGEGQSPGFPLRYRLLTLPTYGGLYYVNETHTTLITEVAANTTSFDGVLEYLPEEGYYNRLNGATFVDRNGVGFYGCTILVAPGCPDTFTYEALLEDANGTDVLVSSEAGTFSIYVEAEYTDITSITAPSPVVVYINQTYYFTGAGNTISIQDYDTDIDWIGVELLTNEDFVGFNATPQEYRTSSYYWSECLEGVELAVCDRVVFFSTLTKANALLQRAFVHSNGGVRNNTSKITVKVYKPETPITFDEFGGLVDETDILDSVQLSKIILLYDGNATAAAALGSTLLYTIILFGGIAAVCVLSCVSICASIWYTCSALVLIPLGILYYFAYYLILLPAYYLIYIPLWVFVSYMCKSRTTVVGAPGVKVETKKV